VLKSQWLKSPWLLAGIALLVAFVALGLYSQTIHESLIPRLYDSASTIRRSMYGKYIFVGIMGLIPGLSGLVMIWIAFLSPRWSDRFLWSAAMIFTGVELGLDANQVFTRAGWAGTTHTYPSPYAVTGLLAYSSWLLIIDRSAMQLWKKRVLGTLCILALLGVLTYPLINSWVNPIDIAGSVLFAASCFCFGVFVATRIGVNLFQHDEQSESQLE